MSRHCIRIGTVLEQLDGGTATRVADAADAADADFIVPHSQNTHLTRTGAAARRSHLLTSIVPHSLFVALALALIAEQRQIGSMRQNAPVDVGAVPAQLHGYGLFFPQKVPVFFSETISRHVHPCPNCFSLGHNTCFPSEVMS